MEGEKNKLENLLTNNLMKKRDRIMLDMQEVSADDTRRKLENLSSDLESVDARIVEAKKQMKSK